MQKSPLIVLVGETASGKSAMALHVAQQFNGEIICADSRTIYKGMDIGTAKPSLSDQAEIKHHLLDIATPDESFTAADFKLRAQAAINDITQRGKLPILVGGTGLYIDSVLYDYPFRPASDPVKRTELNALSVDELRGRIMQAGLELPKNDTNPRHLVRVLETNGAQSVLHKLRPNTLVIGLSIERQILTERIAKRIQVMFESGLEHEATTLLQRYGDECSALQTIGYQEFLPLIHGQATISDVQTKITIATRQYAKRQRTWFKRNKSIHWCDQQIQIVELVTTFLNK